MLCPKQREFFVYAAVFGLFAVFEKLLHPDYAIIY